MYTSYIKQFFILNVSFAYIGQRALDQKNLELAKLQGQVVDLESLRASNQALLVKKTQVECERDELQKKYSEAVKRVGDMEKVTEK